MSSNYYKYYHLRASPISKYEQQPGQVPQAPLPSQSPLQYSGSKIQQETSPWRNLPSSAQALQQQITTSQYVIGDKTLSHLSLEKQNECLRKEKSEYENQIQKLKLYYTKQTTMDQQELMRYEREKASLADKLREMDEMLTSLQEKYEKELNVEKNNTRKVRQEWEGKVERITSYYNEQLSLKQDEIHKTKNKLQLSEINVTDLTAKLKIFEQTNKELRQKWDDDIKNFGTELESLNKQLLSQRFRNDELERLSKINKAVSGNNSPVNKESDSSNVYLREIEILKSQNLEQRNKNFELEKKIKGYESKSSTDGDLQNSIYKDKLEQKIQENEKLKLELNKRLSELEIHLKESQITQSQLKKCEKENTDKDVLVQQMMAHIDQIEKENKELQSGENFNGIEEKLSQLHLENQIQKQELDFFANELERITNRNKLLEEQLYQPETQINSQRQYQQLEKQLDKIDMKCNQIKLEMNKQEESFSYSQRGTNVSVDQKQQERESFGEIQKDLCDISQQVEKVKDDIKSQKEQILEEERQKNAIIQHHPLVQQGHDDSRARKITANFSPPQQRHKMSFNPATPDAFGIKNLAEEQQPVGAEQSTDLKSEFKKVTVPERQVKVNGFEKEHHNLGSITGQLVTLNQKKQEEVQKAEIPAQLVQSNNTPTNNTPSNYTPTNDQEANDNTSQQTFGGRHKSSYDHDEKLNQIEELIGHPDKIKEEQDQKDQQIVLDLLSGKAEASPSTNKASPSSMKPLHQQLKELSDQYQQKDFKPIHPMNLTPKVHGQNQQQEQKKTEPVAFVDSFRDHEQQTAQQKLQQFQQQKYQELLKQQEQQKEKELQRQKEKELLKEKQKQKQEEEEENMKHIIRINDIQQTESIIAEKTPVNRRKQEQVTPPPQQKTKQVVTPPPKPVEVAPAINYNIIPLKTPKIDTQQIDLDITQILSYANIASNSNDNTRHQFDKSLEGTEVFDIIVGFVGASKSGKSTVINSIKKEDWDIATKTEPCNKRLQLFRYTCMNKKVGLCESDMASDQNFMHFICNFAQAIVLFFNSWETTDERTFIDYIKLLQSENNFASECIVIHSSSELLSTSAIDKMTKDLTKLQDGLYRGKVDGKLKKINVYHVMLHNYNDKTKKKSIFEETIAVCRGTIIGKLTTCKEKVDLFKRLNRFLIS